MSKKDVFISYKAEEFDDANWVRSTLENNGISCWMAPMSISGGASYATEIPQAIRSCDVFVLILSRKSQQSKWVPRELDQAINAGKTILPFMLENCELQDDFSFYLTNVQRYAAFENKTAAIEKMIGEIKTIVGFLNESNEKKSAPPENLNIANDSNVQNTKPQSKTDSTNNLPKNKDLKFSKSNAKPLKNKGGSKKGLIITLTAVFSVAVIVGLIVFLNLIDDVTIAGTRYDAGLKSISLKDIKLTDEDLESLKKLDNLTTAEFEGCSFPSSDIGGIFPDKISNLILNNCGLRNEHINSFDFSKVRPFNVELENNPKLTDIGALAGLSDVVYTIDISNTGIKDLSVISKFEKLTNLRADNCGLSDLSDLSGCAKLTSIVVSNNELTNLEGIENCINLKKINAEGNRLETLKGLENATVLSAVVLDNNKLKDISVLSKSAATLEYLSFNNNQISDISPLEDCSLLVLFSADGNKLTNLNALKNCSVLNTVSASGNMIESAQGIASCKTFSYINLSDNKISDSSFVNKVFSESTVDVVLDLSNNKITRFEFPNGHYNYVALYGNKISDYEVANPIKISSLTIDYTDETDLSVFDMEKIYTLKIISCPLDRQISISEEIKKLTVLYVTEDDAANEISDKSYVKTEVPNF